MSGFSRFSANTIFTLLSMCVEDVAHWFLEDGVLLSPAKTEVVLFGTFTERKKLLTASGIDVVGAIIPFYDTVKLLGITLLSMHSALTMDRHVTEVVRSCNIPHTCIATHPKNLYIIFSL